MADGDNGQSRRVGQSLWGLLRVSGSGDVDGVGSGRWGVCQGVVGSRGRYAWAGHGPVWDELVQCLLPMIDGCLALPAI